MLARSLARWLGVIIKNINIIVLRRAIAVITGNIITVIH